MNQERMRCILFQWSERPMGVGLSSKHWALGSHSFSAEQARRAGESVPLPASQRRCVTRAHIHPQQQVRAGTLRARSPAQTRSGETLGFKLALVWFLFYSPETFFFCLKKKRSLFHLYNYSCGSSVTGLSCLKIGLSSAQPLFHPSSAVDLLYFILGRMQAWPALNPCYTDRGEGNNAQGYSRTWINRL